VSLAPVTVTLDGSASLDPDPEASLVAWRWDLDHDGSFAGAADKTGETIDWPIAVPGIYPVTLQVESSNGLTDTVQLQVDASDAPPVPHIDGPPADLHWSVGQAIAFSGSATDDEDGPIPASGLAWTVSLLHCGPSDCHEHVLQAFDGVAGGEISAPDHPYPSKLVLRLDATDSHGATASTTLELDAEPTTLALDSVPAGVDIAVGDGTVTTPDTVTLVRGGSTTLTAPTSWTAGASRYRFLRWSDGLARSHDVTVTDPQSLTATYVTDAPEACANAKTIAKGAWVQDWASGAGDADWFRFTLPSRRRVTVTLGDLPVDARLELFGACGTPLGSSDHAGTRFEELARSLGAGTYRVRVSVPSGDAADSAYVVRVDAVGDRVAVKSASAKRTSGIVRIAGEVLNATGATTGRATIVAELRDAQGRLLKTLTGTSFAGRLGDGGVSPFVITGAGPAFASVTYRVTRGSPKVARTLVLRSLSTTANGNGTVTESGKVRNEGTRTAPAVAVARTWYGVRGQVLDARWVPTSPASLGPGARGTFTILRPVLGTVQAARTQLRPS
jgi:PKD repeat protein